MAKKQRIIMMGEALLSSLKYICFSVPKSLSSESFPGSYRFVTNGKATPGKHRQARPVPDRITKGIGLGSNEKLRKAAEKPLLL